MPQEEAQTRLDYGRFLRRDGQRRAALRELSAARWLFAGLGARPFTERCDAELGQEPAAERAARLPLTARQLAVARAVASGKSNREMARQLYISVKTVEFHVSQILVRLGVDGRAESPPRWAIGPPIGRPVVPPITRWPDGRADGAVPGSSRHTAESQVCRIFR